MQQEIINRASHDTAFRQALLDNPKEAIANFLGVALPPGMNITVLEEKPGHHVLVLPPAPPAVDTLPLAELDLALVGGGRTFRPFTILCRVSNTRPAGHPDTRPAQSSC
jgi:hypothetical protein